jgi:Ubiquitin carboxyl-terminal hydrolase, family 1
MQTKMKMLPNAQNMSGSQIRLGLSLKFTSVLANAAQTTSNACATVALLNIVMNTPEIDLGDALADFKESTRLLKPPYRGQALSHNDFIRNIHNSFLRSVELDIYSGRQVSNYL